MFKWCILLLLFGRIYPESDKCNPGDLYIFKTCMIAGWIGKGPHSADIGYLDESKLSTVAQILQERISLADLYRNFPRLSLQTYAPQEQIGQNPNYFSRAMQRFWYIFRWQLNLLYSLWFTTKRRVIVEKLYVNLEHIVESIKDIDLALEKYLPLISEQIQLLGETNNRGKLWVSKMELFIKGWAEMQKKIASRPIAEVTE